MKTSANKSKPLSIYVHIPFCQNRCPYCDFESSVGGDVGEYTDSLCAEIAACKHDTSKHTVETIYFGGGTPSFIPHRFIGRILFAINSRFNISDNPEITIECNPCSLTEEKLVAYKNFGINRVSIGVQSFSPRTLKILGRKHSVSTAKRAIKLARKHIENVSIDLIHSVPGGKLVLPKRYLRMLEHVSAYALTSDNFPPYDEDKSVFEQNRVVKVLEQCGHKRYEVSNYAQQKFQSKHNLCYWTCGEWLGFGRGAKSHFGEKWSDADRVMLGLRLTDGVDEKLLSGRKKIVDDFVAQGLMIRHGKNIACTDRGMMVLNRILVLLDI
ncbi:MAG: radical SAM family heme chaperone HemW [Firmicutes bacterium]|nr:radical SAM family heme chaperone HemW [Bacillota bacterium]